MRKGFQFTSNYLPCVSADLYYPIIDIIRQEAKRYDYRPQEDQNIVVIDENGSEWARIPMNRFLEQSKSLFDEIRANHSPSFSVPDAETFMGEVGCTKLKAPSKDKADIQIIIHDLRTGMQPLLGFSIKSQLGTPSTLLNAGKTTNVRFRLEGTQLTDADIQRINSIDGHIERMQAVMDAGCSLTFDQVENETFRNNLIFIDSALPMLVGLCLKEAIFNASMPLAEAVDNIAKGNPLHYGGSNVQNFYEHKLKMLLLDAALGMTPAKEWNGHYDANGGYIVIRKDGEIVCYHFYNRNDVEDYLYCNTRLEHASRTRYEFGSLFRNGNGDVCLRLNLQIRFKK